MSILMVVNDPDSWPLSIPGVEVVAARRYISDPVFHRLNYARVFNLCKSYSYQNLGYYVSLLAEARGHRPQPDVMTIQDMKSSGLVRTIADDLDELIQKTLRTVNGHQFDLSIYFGKTVTKRDNTLGHRIFGHFRSPLLRAHFSRRDKHWHLNSVRPIPASEIPDSHHGVVIDAAREYFARRYRRGRAAPPAYDMAILYDPTEQAPPSNEKALQRFQKAAQKLGVGAELITRDDYAHLGEFDALFIRATTYVNHYTYRFSRRAVAEGLAVIDDPTSIARCSNKVYLAELMTLHRVPIPRTVIVHRDNVRSVIGTLGLPLVLKKPDGAFSQGVVKVSDPEEFRGKIAELLEKSEPVIAQAWMPTSFDWRVGVLDGDPLFVCKYHMAPNHWQIVNWGPNGDTDYGIVETLTVDAAPRRVVAAAVRAAKLIGDGFYGVDLKVIDDEVLVVEVNDNPNVDAGFEDRMLKDELYERVVGSFIQRIERIRSEASARAGRENGNGAGHYSGNGNGSNGNGNGRADGNGQSNGHAGEPRYVPALRFHGQAMGPISCDRLTTLRRCIPPLDD